LEGNVDAVAPKAPKASANQKHAKFRNLAEKRTNNALEAIRRIGNLSNRTLYEWEDGELKRIVRALRDAVADVEVRFASPKGKADARFKL
jgi:hypothetical protein